MRLVSIILIFMAIQVSERESHQGPQRLESGMISTATQEQTTDQTH